MNVLARRRQQTGPTGAAIWPRVPALRDWRLPRHGR